MELIDKQIEEMAKEICAKCKSDTKCERKICTMAYREAEHLVINKSYRKSSDVAREIFEEIERNIFKIETPYGSIHCIPNGLIAELKKKYAEDK